MENIDFEKLTVGEIVTADFRTAEVFRQAGIDFCCGGKKGFSQSCRETGIDPEALKANLDRVLAVDADRGIDYREWDPVFLCDYIVNTHHRYVKGALPDLGFYTGKIARVHGEHHPELLEIARIFAELGNELTQHLNMEEEVLFPAIRRLAAGSDIRTAEVIRSEISRMAGEHEAAGGAMDRIRGLSGGYVVPPDGCNTFALTYQLLDRFEADLHIHVHLENNILFPKALKMAE